jgi:hypothetical protein
VSAYKSGLKSAGKKGGPKRKPGRPRKNPIAAVASAPVTVRAAATSGGSGTVSIDDIAIIKGLLNRVGSKGVEKLLSALS